MAKAARPNTGLAPLLGITMEREDAASRSSVTVRPDLLNPHGVLAGPVMYSLADFGMGAALYSRLGDSESCATIEIKMVYIATVTKGDVVCETRLVNKGRSVAVLESEVFNEGRLVAKALGTFAIFAVR
ncbi:MAG: PaaI family thioesterase [Chloroflexi bacterium]|nr:PaaI family thioesterase [Chloroflexota bacterium]